MKTVLIIEDDAANRELLTQLLEDDFDVVSADDGAAGLFSAIDNQPDLVILDLSMPRIGGWDVLKMLKADERTQTIPVVVLTGKTAAEVREKAERLGSAAFVTKPYEIDDLLAVITRTISGE